MSREFNNSTIMAKCASGTCGNNIKKGSKTGLCKNCSERNSKQTNSSTLANTPSQKATTTDPSAQDVEMTVASNEETDTFFLRFSMVAKPFRLPKYVEIANAALEYFQDPSLKVSMRRFGAEKIYRIKLNSKTKKDDRSLKLPCNGVELQLPLISDDPFVKKSTKEDGILLTFNDAFDGQLENLPNDVFDKAVVAFNLQLIRPTQLQKIPGSSAYNGNRYCVIKIPDSLNAIPEFLPITHTLTKVLHNVKTTFKGQSRFCPRCMQKHVGQCPQLKDFFDALAHRNKMKDDKEITTKITSDSTLRLADPLGLTAAVSTMSGGGLGQIVQATLDDPENDEMSHLILVGGANDSKNSSFENNEEYAENIDTTMKKIVAMANANPTKEFTIVNSHPRVENQKDVINTAVKTLYLHRKAKQIAENGPAKNISVSDIQYDTDSTLHPTEKGTEDILHQLHHHCNDSLIWNKHYVTAKRMYSRVESIYRYGCNHCDEYGTNITREYMNPLLCDSCHVKNKENAKEKVYPLLVEIVAEMNETVIDDHHSVTDGEEHGVSAKRLKPNEPIDTTNAGIKGRE